MPLKLYKRGKVWWISGTVCGVPLRKTTKLQSRRLADLVRIKTESRLLEEYVNGTEAVVTFSEAVESYITNGGPPRFLQKLQAHFDETKLKDIKQNDLDEAARKLYPTAQPETRNRQCYTPFIAVWNHAVRNEWAKTKSWGRPRKPKGTRQVKAPTRAGTAPIDYDRAARFVAAMSPAPAMLMTTLFYTGMRPIEAFSLTAGEVDVKARWIVLLSSKTGEPRGVPMHEFLVPILESLLKRQGLGEDGGLAADERIFRTPRGEPYTDIVTDEEHKGGGGLKTAIIGARRRSGIKDVSPYTARHTVSTGLVVAGVHQHVKDQILGHAADTMSRHYTNVPQAPLIEAINKLPVPDAWRFMPWLEDPLAWSGRLAEGTGRRTDLERKRSANARPHP